MPFIEFLDQRRKWDTFVVIAVILAAVVLCLFVFFASLNMVREERKNVYVLDGMAVPYVATQTGAVANLGIEARAHIALFHQLFFTLAPDEKYINYNIEKAMYLIDESGLLQRNTLEEKGFYQNIMSASANFSIMTDSIKFDEESMKFVYYGRQRIERPSSTLYRELVTEGSITHTKRSENNPHGLLIINYRTIRNRDLEEIRNRNF